MVAPCNYGGVSGRVKVVGGVETGLYAGGDFFPWSNILVMLGKKAILCDVNLKQRTCLRCDLCVLG